MRFYKSSKNWTFSKIKYFKSITSLDYQGLMLYITIILHN
nr:MAG TPA: hypothetical protein [Caudoviricetes sp.]